MLSMIAMKFESLDEDEDLIELFQGESGGGYLKIQVVEEAVQSLLRMSRS